MKHLIRRIALGLALVLLLCSCGASTQPKTDGNTESTDKTEWQSMPYDEIRFASKREIRTWQRALSKTLLQMKNSFYDEYYNDSYEGDYWGYMELDGILYSHYLALFDIDVDGIPELLVDMGGGSAGNLEFVAYDIFTGEEKGDLGSGYQGNWCTYYNTETDEFCQVGDYILRGGYGTYYHYICRQQMHGAKEELLFHTTYELEHESIIENGEVVDYRETWVANEFEHNGERASMEDYLYGHQQFQRTNIRIPQTEMIVLSMGDLLENLNEKEELTNAPYLLSRRGAKKVASRMFDTQQMYIRIDG